MDALNEAIELLGSAAELARASGVSPQVINNALSRGSVSPKLAQAIEKATDGKVSKVRLVWGDTPTAGQEAA